MAFFNEIKKHEQLTDAEFELVVKQMRAKRDAASIRAAYRVLVQDSPSYLAAKHEGSSDSNVCDTIKRILERHHENMAVYGRFEPPCEKAVWGIVVKLEI
ncbi:hypothetical protein LU11_gp014 [Pseudomonas phage Lu11]|uniref:hypothetical protein n=1 Tax=Pseudomonas phage Lu11 TaxID=1161927 RepID=UPI00025F14E8|nr:hypothetical protein LU11_gp014 [Pseudomonas phage Lu11]AFH14545.1 hypothetical protein Lu11_0014 [Pseudomonas phage Lu11]